MSFLCKGIRAPQKLVVFATQGSEVVSPLPEIRQAKVYGDTEYTPAWMKRASAMHSSHSTEATMGYTDTDLEHTKKRSEVMPKLRSTDGCDSCIQTADADMHHAFYRAMQHPVVDTLQCPSNFSRKTSKGKLENAEMSNH